MPIPCLFFLQSMLSVLGTVRTTLEFKGRLGTYNSVDGVWKGVVRDAQVKVRPGDGSPEEDVTTSLVKVVAIDHKLITP